MHGEQIGVCAEDQVCLAVESDFEKLVVFGIAAFTDWVHDRHEFCHASQQAQKLLTVRNADVAVELVTGENVRLGK